MLVKIELEKNLCMMNFLYSELRENKVEKIVSKSNRKFRSPPLHRQNRMRACNHTKERGKYRISGREWRLYIICILSILYCCTMNNQIYKVHGTPSLLHRSQRKLVALSLPTLEPIYKYYTRSRHFHVTGSHSRMVIDGSNISFLTI